MSDARLIVLQLLVALGIPALIAILAPQRWRVRGLLLWMASPLLVLLVLGAVDWVRHPPGPGGVQNLIFGLMLIGSFLVLPWIFACLAGYGIGMLLRRKTAVPPEAARMEPPRVEPAPSEAAQIPPEEIVPPPDVPLSSSSAALLTARKSSATSAPPWGWHAAHVGFERDGFVLDGLDIWASSWREEDVPPVMLEHPAHPGQLHSFTVYSADDGTRATRFAVTELSNGVWGFYRWTAPADAAQGLSADGSLRYAHSFGELVGGRYDAVAPVATLHDAATGKLLFDGSAWYSSRVVPQADGALLLLLHANDHEAIFRIDPATGRFRDLLVPDRNLPIAELGATAAAAHAESIDPRNTYTRRRIAPDGSLLVDLAAVEWSNTHWVFSPRVIEIATGRVLLDLWGTDWDAEISFPYDRTVRMSFRRYRSRGSLDAEIDAGTGRYLIAERSGARTEGTLADLPAALERASRRAATAGAAEATPLSHGHGGAPHSTLRSWGVALLILIGALAAIAGGSFIAYQLDERQPQRLDTIPPMPKFEPPPMPRFEPPPRPKL